MPTENQSPTQNMIPLPMRIIDRIKAEATLAPGIWEAIEVAVKNAAKPAQQHQGEPVAVVDEGDDGLFVDFIYGENGNPLRRGDKLYSRPALDITAQQQLPLLELTDDLREILGRPNFNCSPIAKALRIMGLSIAHKAEDEQAVMIHWLLGHYLKHGAEWYLRATEELREASLKLKC